MRANNYCIIIVRGKITTDFPTKEEDVNWHSQNPVVYMSLRFGMFLQLTASYGLQAGNRGESPYKVNESMKKWLLM